MPGDILIKKMRKYLDAWVHVVCQPQKGIVSGNIYFRYEKFFEIRADSQDKMIAAYGNALSGFQHHDQRREAWAKPAFRLQPEIAQIIERRIVIDIGVCCVEDQESVVGKISQGKCTGIPAGKSVCFGNIYAVVPCTGDDIPELLFVCLEPFAGRDLDRKVYLAVL